MRILEEFWYGNIEPTEYDTSSCKECRADWNCLEKFRTTRPLESGCLIVPLIQHIKRTIIRQVYNTH